MDLIDYFSEVRFWNYFTIKQKRSDMLLWNHYDNYPLSLHNIQAYIEQVCRYSSENQNYITTTFWNFQDSIDVYSSDNESCTSSDYNFQPQKHPKNKSFSTRKSYTEVAPDGGWGWIICIATFMCHFVVGGTYYSYGIMLPHLIQQFESDHVTISMIGSGKNLTHT